jgi:hypothetical protein
MQVILSVDSYTTITKGQVSISVSLILYRNCSATCAQCAPFDAHVYIQVFDSAGNFIQAVPANMSPSDTISDTPNFSCLHIPDICVEYATYQTNITLPYLAGGYVLVYQRCCRSNEIGNVVQNSGFDLIIHGLPIPLK